MPTKNDVSSFKKKERNNDQKEKILPSKEKGSKGNAKKTKPTRSPKTIRFRDDYQRKLEKLAINQKGVSGKNVPDLTEEALEFLFEKYDVDVSK